jgi:polysaccharide export outer membrane protein
MAGGFTEWANKRKVLIITKENGKEKRITANYNKIIDGDIQDIVIKPGDTLIIP